jgi:polyisoprenoid-binding protein YceI
VANPIGRRYYAGVSRSPFLPVALPLAAIAASVARWLAQGTQNLYTSLHQRFYIPDPDFGWRESQQRPLWLGLEIIAVLAGVAVAIVIAGLWIRRRERAQKSATLLRVLSWIAAPLPALVPIAAFASGPGPANARVTLPVGATAAAPTAGIEGSLALPPGTYDVIAHRGTLISAKIKAGGDEFDATFAGDPQGTWQADPSSFTQPMTAEVSVAAASVDTGIDLRSEHARGEYLHADKFPRIKFSLKRLIAARQDAPTAVAFRGAGTVELLGKPTEVEVTGTIEAASEAQRQRLGLADRGQVALVKAQFVLPLAASGLTASDYNTDKFPISVSLVLTHHNK